MTVEPTTRRLIPVPDLPEAGGTWQHLAPRLLSAEERARLEGHVAEILEALGLDVGTPGTVDTPRRFLQALADSTAGYDGDPKLVTLFPAEAEGGPDSLSGTIIEGPITFHALCEHHALPFVGTAHVGYVPGDFLVGISKLTRLVHLFARRFTVQERMAEQIADGLMAMTGARGVAVHLQAAHLCTQMRGVREERSVTATSTWRGAFAHDAALRQEFLLETRGR
jgi:GTP cyclohydrolase I